MKRNDYPELRETIFEETLENGLRVIVVKKSGFSKSHAIFAARYGGADRRFRLGGEWLDTPAGIAHFLEHKMFDMPDGSNVMQLFSSRGASPNAYTASDVTAYYFSCTGEFEENLKTLLTFVSTPYYTPESVQKEQGIIGQEIRMTENNPGFVGYYDMFQSLYAAHPIRYSVAGTVESIAEITAETLYNCHKVFYNPSNMVLCCVGDVDPERICAAARAILPGESGEVTQRDYGPDEGILPARAYFEREMPVSAPQFCLGAKVLPAAESAEQLRQSLLGDLAMEYLAGLASPFYTELYEKGLLGRDYDFCFLENCGVMCCLISGESKAPDKVRDALLKHAAGIAQNGVDEKRFERCRRALYGANLSVLDTFDSYARQLFRGAMYGRNVMDSFSLLDSFTAADVAAFIAETITADRLALSVIRPNHS